MKICTIVTNAMYTAFLSFSFGVIFVDFFHCRRVNRDATMTTDEASYAAKDTSLTDAASKLDLAFKEGETIKINITVSTMLSLVKSHY